MSQTENGLTVRFWGTRGSIPTPGPHTEKYGGNTTCLEVRCGGTLVIFDAGSGIRNLGASWMREFGRNPVQAHLLFTHLHWDHIQGFPFFAPAYRKGNAFTIWGADRSDGSVGELLSGQMRGSYFPVPLWAMQAERDFRTTGPVFEVGPVRVRTAELPHPGGCLGYRLEAGGSVFVLATDSEFDQVALNKEEVTADHLAPRQYEPALLDFLRGAHMLVIDCQYPDEEYQGKRNWGHNSIAAVADLCAQVRPSVLVLFHHDPESSDKKVSAMVAETCSRLEGGPAAQTLVVGARERLTMRVGEPIRPLALPQG
jgi:ribonuclease Z